MFTSGPRELAVLDQASQILAEARTLEDVKGISLHVGLNSVDPKHYGGWNGPLAACEFDARDMRQIANKLGYTSKLLLTEQATYDAVTDAIRTAAKKLSTGDIFLLSYSGHGGQVSDTNGTEEEDAKDETWVLYNRQLVDDELYTLWSLFEAGVRILMFSDSCHSGTMAKQAMYDALSGTRPFAKEFPDRRGGPRFRIMPQDVQQRTYKKQKKLYDQVQRDHPAGERVAIGASVLLISGCQDNQYSSDGDRNGAFTGTMKAVWSNGRFKQGYRAFHKAIAQKMPPWQTPNYFRIGPTNLAFERQRPFTI